MRIRLIKNRYKYNLSQVINQCELNYMMLNRLMINVDDFDIYVDRTFSLNFIVTERCKYTTFIQLKIKTQLQSELIPEFCIDLRLYHDAHLVEVVDKNGAAIPPIHPYPNSKMQQMNEKQGLNEFLGEWLSFCLKNGRSTETIAYTNSKAVGE